MRLRIIRAVGGFAVMNGADMLEQFDAHDDAQAWAMCLCRDLGKLRIACEWTDLTDEGNGLDQDGEG
ncbi:MAG: hypothetical protein BGN86_06950 [Caulobacterales bacterium 68-7]|nr:MAG: hypothetical protein BGN86_06950 [Caulobacterales bacterium 68-7]